MCEQTYQVSTEIIEVPTVNRNRVAHSVDSFVTKAVPDATAPILECLGLDGADAINAQPRARVRGSGGVVELLLSDKV